MPKKDRVSNKGQYPIFTGYRIAGFYDEYNCDEKLIVVARGVGGTGDVKISPKKSYLTNISIMIDLDEEVASKKYLYYQLTAGLKYLDTGSAQSQITTSDLKRLKVSLPTIEEQNKIADILGTIDEKIELNRQMNETLEQMGQALFRHYFIDNLRARKWKNKTLEDISTTITRGFTAKYADKSNIINLNQKVNKGSTLDKQYFKYYVPDTVVPADKFAKDGDILINSLGQGTLGRVHHYIENTNNVVVDQHITIVRSNLHNYLYYRLAYFDNQRLQSMISGTTGMLMLNISKIRQFKLPDPGEDREVLDKFDRAVDSFNEQKNKNNQEIQTLTTLRDTLLPRLISGKVKV